MNKSKPTQSLITHHLAFSALSINNFFFDKKSLVNLSKTCRTMDLVLSDAVKFREKLHVLAKNIVLGNEDKARENIEETPELLLYKISIIDYSDRQILGTPFQIALGAEDIQMCEMLLPHFKKLRQGMEIAIAQFDEQFPHGVNADNSYEDLLPLYERLAQDIIINKNGALQSFHNKITECNLVTKERHFNTQHLVAALLASTPQFVTVINKAYIYKKKHEEYQEKIFNLRFKRPSIFDENAQAAHIKQVQDLEKKANEMLERYETEQTKNVQNIYFNKVIGFLQRQLPANYAQLHCTGLRRKSLTCRKLSIAFMSTSFFPQDKDSGLGYDYAYLYHDKTVMKCESFWESSGDIMSEYALTLDAQHQNKTQRLLDIREHLQQSLSRHCQFNLK